MLLIGNLLFALKNNLSFINFHAIVNCLKLKCNVDSKLYVVSEKDLSAGRIIAIKLSF